MDYGRTISKDPIISFERLPAFPTGSRHPFSVLQTALSSHQIFSGTNMFFCFPGLLGREHKFPKHGSRITLGCYFLILNVFEMILRQYRYSYLLCDRPSRLNSSQSVDIDASALPSCPSMDSLPPPTTALSHTIILIVHRRRYCLEN